LGPSRTSSEKRVKENVAAQCNERSLGPPDRGHNTDKEKKNHWAKLQGQGQNSPMKNFEVDGRVTRCTE
jgi:hypothetical protein